MRISRCCGTLPLATVLVVKKCHPLPRPLRRSASSITAAACAAAAWLWTAVDVQAQSAVMTTTAATATTTASAAIALPAPVREAALALVQQAAATLAPAGAKVHATAGAFDPRLRLAPCARIEPYLVAGLPAWGTTRVGLRCTAGAVAWRAFLPVQVQVLAPAWTSKAALPTGALVAAEQWQLAVADWAAGSTPPLGPDVQIAGRTLVRPLAAGQALRESDLQARRWFANGQTVRIVAAGSGYQITTDGQALGHGIEGQPVRVRTEGGRILTGQAVGEGLVEVRL